MATAKRGAEPKRKPGRPSKYHEDVPKQAAKLCALGATDADLADFFGVNVDTILSWRETRPEFSGALKKAKENLDAQVERRLFERAMGYSHPEDDIRVANGEIIITPTVKHYPPDTVAAIFWLKNRRPGQWRAQPSEGDESAPQPVRVVVEVKDASKPEPEGG